MYSFPPPSPIWPHALEMGLRLLLLLIVFGAIAGLLLRRKRKARRIDVFIWFVAGLALAWGFANMTTKTKEPMVVVNASMVLLWLVVAAGIIVSYRRMNRQNLNPIFGSAVTSLAVLGIVMVSLLPSAEAHREAINRRQCKDNLYNLGIAFRDYEQANGRLPPQADGAPRVSWRVDLLPYIGRGELHAAYDRASAWDSAANLPLARHFVSDYSCPTTPDAFMARDGLRFTSYAIAVGDHGLWTLNGPTSLKDVPDGGSQTLLLYEACGQQIVWTEPRDMELNVSEAGINLPGEDPGRSTGVLSSYHSGGAHATFADGAVHFLSDDIDPKVLDALLTTDGGEDVEF